MSGREIVFVCFLFVLLFVLVTHSAWRHKTRPWTDRWKWSCPECNCPQPSRRHLHRKERKKRERGKRKRREEKKKKEVSETKQARQKKKKKMSKWMNEWEELTTIQHELTVWLLCCEWLKASVVENKTDQQSVPEHHQAPKHEHCNVRGSKGRIGRVLVHAGPIHKRGKRCQRHVKRLTEN